MYHSNDKVDRVATANIKMLNKIVVNIVINDDVIRFEVHFRQAEYAIGSQLLKQDARKWQWFNSEFRTTKFIL
jgi:hypothetical protein